MQKHASEQAADNDTRHIFALFGRADRVVEDLYSRHLKRIDLTKTQYLIMTALRHNPGIIQAEIVDQTGIDRSTVADVVARLERRGLVSRSSSTCDSRVKRCCLSNKALELLSEADDLRQLVDNEIKSFIPDEDWDSFVFALGALSGARQGSTS